MNENRIRVRVVPTNLLMTSIYSYHGSQALHCGIEVPSIQAQRAITERTRNGCPSA